MPSPSEISVAKSLRLILQSLAPDQSIEDIPEWNDLAFGLEYFIPENLAEIFPYWKSESLDAFYPALSKLIDPHTLELRGMCILISDQTFTPFHFFLQLAPDADKIDWFVIRLGNPGDQAGNMQRIPHTRSPALRHQYLQQSLQPIDWVYAITFGTKR